MSIVPRSKVSGKNLLSDRLSERQRAAIQANEKRLLELASKLDVVDPGILEAASPPTQHQARGGAVAQAITESFSGLRVGVRSIAPALRSIQFSLSADDRWWNGAVSVDKADGFEFSVEMRDLDGAVYVISRIWSEAQGRKLFYVQMPDGGVRDQGALDTSRFIPYFMNEALRAPATDPIIICEGYRAAKALRDLGFAAVGTLDGSTTPDLEVFAPLKGRRVLLWPDNDDVGVTLMASIRLRLIEAGAKEILLVRWRDGPLHGDAANVLPTRSAVDALLSNASPWPPDLIGRLAQPPRLQRVGSEMHLRARSIIARGGRS